MEVDVYAWSRRVYLRCRRIIVLLYIKGVGDGAVDGFKGTSRCVFANGTQSHDAESGTLVYMISTFLAPCSWLNGVALALVPPRGARYRSRGWEKGEVEVEEEDRAMMERAKTGPRVNGRRRGCEGDEETRGSGIEGVEKERNRSEKWRERDRDGVGLVRVNIAASRAL